MTDVCGQNITYNSIKMVSFQKVSKNVVLKNENTMDQFIVQ